MLSRSVTGYSALSLLNAKIDWPTKLKSFGDTVDKPLVVIVKTRDEPEFALISDGQGVLEFYLSRLLSATTGDYPWFGQPTTSTNAQEYANRHLTPTQIEIASMDNSQVDTLPAAWAQDARDIKKIVATYKRDFRLLQWQAEQTHRVLSAYKQHGKQAALDLTEGKEGEDPKNLLALIFWMSVDTRIADFEVSTPDESFFLPNPADVALPEPT